jgi:D-glycero-D-manno-heptose 1,7-bisphosphate phosphatase
MLLEAAREHDIDLSTSWMIGDSHVDVEAGRNAGCKTALLADRGDVVETNADIVAPSLFEVVRQILEQEQYISDRRPRLQTHTRF